MKTITAANKTCTLYWTTGTVANSGKSMETIVRGSGGGGSNGNTAPVHISSTTVIHDQVFLIDPKGNEHAFQLQNFNIACRESNQLSVIWAIPPGKQRGPYIIAYNHTTGNAFFNDSELTKLFRYAIWYLLAAIGICILLGRISGFFYILAIAAPFVWQYIAKQEAKKFKEHLNYTEFI